MSGTIGSRLKLLRKRDSRRLSMQQVGNGIGGLFCHGVRRNSVAITGHQLHQFGMHK
jgi:hypothetical protein